MRDTLQRLGLFDSTVPVSKYLSDTVSISAFVPPLLALEPLTGVRRPRNFAIVLFGREPQRFVPGAVSFFSKYEGLDRAANKGQRLELAATLLEQLRVLLPAVQAEAQTLFDKNDPVSPSLQKYPTRAIREAVVNAFAHRDYQLTDPLRVTAFQDRIEISSPGGLMLGVSTESVTSGNAGPFWRNQTLAWFLTRLGYAEAEGQGLRTIVTTLREAGCPPPEYEISEIRVRCTLRAHPRSAARLPFP
jgi:ATP-dependent DNA helicase RecG